MCDCVLFLLQPKEIHLRFWLSSFLCFSFIFNEPRRGGKCIFQHLILFKKIVNTYLKLEIRVVCREFLAFRYKSDDYLYLYIRIFDNLRLKQVFWYTISICICVGRYRILNGYCVVGKWCVFLILKVVLCSEIILNVCLKNTIILAFYHMYTV